MSIEHVLTIIKEQNIQFVSLRFTNTQGKEQQITLSATQITSRYFTEGVLFDGASIQGWKPIHESDMLLIPDPATMVLDPFSTSATLILRCDIVEPSSVQGYECDPRSLCKRAESFLADSGIAEQAIFGPELEFFLFDNICFEQSATHAYYHINTIDNNERSKKQTGHHIRSRSGYCSVPPLDPGHELRSSIALMMEKMGLTIETHHHEIAFGQHEVTTRFNTMTKKADEVQIYKYVVRNVAHQFNKTATFMPKPLMGDNGSGMHCHISLFKQGRNLFCGEKYAGLSDMALFFIGGIIKHAKALNAFSNPTTNSYKRLVPGYEAPVILAYSARNRSASIRIPLVNSTQARRIEVRFPDPAANPYLTFAALLMAGLDGIIHQIHPGEAIDKNLYAIPHHEALELPTVARSLPEALDNLDRDRAFLTRDSVFSDSMIDAYIALKKTEINRVYTTPHPIEFELYYSA